MGRLAGSAAMPIPAGGSVRSLADAVSPAAADAVASLLGVLVTFSIFTWMRRPAGGPDGPRAGGASTYRVGAGLLGFLFVLVILFGAAFAAGRAAGPLSPGVWPWGGVSDEGPGNHMPGMSVNGLAPAAGLVTLR
jgi:hypothetical protein